MKRLKSVIAMLLCAVLLFQPITACAATKDVTRSMQDKALQVLDICRAWLAVSDDLNFKFDSLTKTAMACYYLDFTGSGLDRTLDQVKSTMKLYFGDDKATFAYKKIDPTKNRYKANELFVQDGSKVISYMGEYGEDEPQLLIKKILQTGNNTYKISVISMTRYPNIDYSSKEYWYYGEYDIGMKTANNKLGYIITSIVQKEKATKMW